jgi:hypothetical protein
MALVSSSLCPPSLSAVMLKIIQIGTYSLWANFVDVRIALFRNELWMLSELQENKSGVSTIYAIFMLNLMSCGSRPNF